MKRWGVALALAVLTCLLASMPSLGQTPCPTAAEISAEGLIGSWTVELHGQPPERWSLTLLAHPEHTGSLKGRLLQGTRTAEVVADWDEGEFTMEESHDGLRIAATWLGTASEGQCGRQIEGMRQADAAPASPTRFTMRRGR